MHTVEAFGAQHLTERLMDGDLQHQDMVAELRAQVEESEQRVRESEGKARESDERVRALQEQMKVTCAYAFFLQLVLLK